MKQNYLRQYVQQRSVLLSEASQNDFQETFLQLTKSGFFCKGQLAASTMYHQIQNEERVRDFAAACFLEMEDVIEYLDDSYDCARAFRDGFYHQLETLLALDGTAFVCQNT